MKRSGYGRGHQNDEGGAARENLSGEFEMKKVIDANYFQDPALENYLRADVSNKVIFTDYAGMEMLKGNAIRNVYKSIQIVSRYPEQVIILKHTSPAVKIGGISNDPQECFEDPI